MLMIFTGIGAGSTGCDRTPDSSGTDPGVGPMADEFLGVPSREIEEATRNHLQTWYPAIIDTVDGGYYTNFEYDWTRSGRQPKMLVTQARGLWTAARAANNFSDNEEYIEAAEHGFEFLTGQMWDEENGGFFNEFRDGGVVRSTPYKMAYANAFALYAFAEYAKLNPTDEALMWVERTFDWLEEFSHDPQHGGYHNLILSDELRERYREDPEAVRSMGWGRPDWKGQNTNIHVLEALSAAYKVLPLPKVQDRLSEMISLIRDTFVTPEGHLTLYFTADWDPIDHSDSSRSYILENQQYDHISFGHDIETAYLLIDASESLNNEVDEKTLRVAKRLVDHTLVHGFDDDYHGVLYSGYRFDEEGEVEILNRSKSWWAQFEGWHTLALMYSFFPDEEEYAIAFRKMWDYMQEYIFDHEYGGVYNNGIDEDPDNRHDRKAHEWKGPYHDGRALMYIRNELYP